MKINLTLITLGTAFLAAPAGASITAAQDRGGTSPAVQQTKYCIDWQQTGSRLTERTCKTKSEWAKENVDIDKLLKK